MNPARLVKVLRFSQCVLPDGFPKSHILYRLEQLAGIRLLGQIFLGRAHLATYGEALEPKVEKNPEGASVQRVVPVHFQKLKKDRVHAAHSIPTHKPKALTTAAAARILGVTREHLSRVLHGHRESRSLRRRYADLAEQKGAR